jgi:chromosomal replication initiation ATPase DnaA
MNPKVENIIRECAAKHNVSFSQVIGKNRTRSFVNARWEALYRIREELRPTAIDPNAYSLPRIGQFFGGMDHSSVIHGIKRHKERMGVK